MKRSASPLSEVCKMQKTADAEEEEEEDGEEEEASEEEAEEEEEEKETPNLWPAFKLSENARDIIRQADKNVQIMPADVFSIILDIMAYEAFFENNGNEGFYFNRSSLIAAFGKKQIYGLAINQDVADSLTGEYNRSLKTCYPNEIRESQQQFQSEFWSVFPSNRETDPRFAGLHKLATHSFESVRFPGLIGYGHQNFLPFLCYVDEDDFGRVEIIWTHSSVRRLGLAKCFVDFRFHFPDDYGEFHSTEFCVEWLPDYKDIEVPFTIPDKWIPRIRNRLEFQRLSPVDSYLCFPLLQCILKYAPMGKVYRYDDRRPAYNCSDEVIDAFHKGLALDRVYVVSIERKYMNLPEVTDKTLKECGFQYLSNWMADYVLPFVCILDKQGGYSLLWSHPSIACLKLEEWIHAKRVRKFVAETTEEGKLFWERMGFSTTVPEPTEKYLDDTWGSVNTLYLYGKDVFPRDPENCEKLAALLNEKLGSDYHCVWLQRVENGIEFHRCPGGWTCSYDGSFEKTRTKEVRFDGGRAGKISLKFRWTNAIWEEKERVMVIACFMKIFGFDTLEAGFHKKEEIETLFRTL